MKLNRHFFDTYTQLLKKTSVSKNGKLSDFKDLDDFPLMHRRQCIYVMDWEESRITYSRGVFEMLGYTASEFNIEAVSEYFHPDDKLILGKVIRGAMEHVVSAGMDARDLYHLMTYRLRKKNGEYVKVLRKTIGYEFDESNVMISNLSFLTDISFISNGNKVEWDLYVKDLDIEALRRDIQRQFIDFFSARELEIITLIQKGLSSKNIADKMCVSPHTVATHRKNILRKSGCHNSAELLAFCVKNGIL